LILYMDISSPGCGTGTGSPTFHGRSPKWYHNGFAI